MTRVFHGPLCGPHVSIGVVKPVTTESQAASQADTGESRTLRNYVAGEWRPASATDVLEDRDPVSGEVSALVPLSGADDVGVAVRAAREAQPAWRDLARSGARGRSCACARSRFPSRRSARLVTDDMGKTLRARGEVGRGISRSRRQPRSPTC